MNQYQEFHRLKKQIINKLISIEDGARMECYAQNFLEDVTNEDTFEEVVEMMAEASILVKKLTATERGTDWSDE